MGLLLLLGEEGGFMFKEIEKMKNDALKEEYYNSFVKNAPDSSPEEKRRIKRLINTNIDRGITDFTIETLINSK